MRKDIAMERGLNLRRLGLLAGMVGSLSLSYVLFEKGTEYPSSESSPSAVTSFNNVATFQGPDGEDEYCIVGSGHKATDRIFKWCYDSAYHLSLSRPVPSNVINRYSTGSESAANPQNPDLTTGDEANASATSTEVSVSSVPSSEMHEALWVSVPAN